MIPTYNIILTKYPVDGLKIALQAQAAEKRVELIIVLTGGTGCALAFGFTTPNDYAGIVGLMHYGAQDYANQVTYEGNRYPVVFPAGQGAGVSPYAEFLDRMRGRLTEYPKITLVMEYARIESDLPPLNALDGVGMYWEIRDLLTDATLQQMKYLSERILNEGPHFHGFQFYARGETSVNLEARKKAIEEAAQIPANTKLLQI